MIDMTDTPTVPDYLRHIRVVLARTSHPGNIGAAARAMKTMGARFRCRPGCRVPAAGRKLHPRFRRARRAGAGANCGHFG